MRFNIVVLISSWSSFSVAHIPQQRDTDPMEPACKNVPPLSLVQLPQSTACDLRRCRYPLSTATLTILRLTGSYWFAHSHHGYGIANGHSLAAFAENPSVPKASDQSVQVEQFRGRVRSTGFKDAGNSSAYLANIAFTEMKGPHSSGTDDIQCHLASCCIQVTQNFAYIHTRLPDHKRVVYLML